MKLIVPSESPDCAASSDTWMTRPTVTVGRDTMSDTIMVTHYDRKAEARAKALREVRHALGVSIIGAIKNAGDLDKLGAPQLRVLLDTVKIAADYAERELDELKYMEWEKATHGDDDAN